MYIFFKWNVRLYKQIMISLIIIMLMFISSCVRQIIAYLLCVSFFIPVFFLTYFLFVDNKGKLLDIVVVIHI